MGEDISEAVAEKTKFTYDYWMEGLGLPIHTGYFIGDLRTCDLEWWEDRKCKAAFMQLMGQEGVTGAWIQEIAPGESSPPVRFALDEVCLRGRGPRHHHRVA